MSLDPPGPVVMILNILGLPWPGVNEDQLHDWARSVRQFSGDICDNSSQVNQAMRELVDTSQSAVITSAADFWEAHHQLLVDLRGPLGVFAEALDLVGYEVVAQKWAVLGAAGAMATEFAVTQAGALFTFGADEAALPAELALTREVVKEALEKLTVALIGGGLQLAIQEIVDHLNRTMGSILNTAFEVHMEVHSLRILYKTLRDTVQRIRDIINTITEIASNAHSQNANRDLADSSGGGGWSEIIHIIEEGVKDFFTALLKSLPSMLIQSLEALTLGLLKLADRAEAADSGGAPSVPRRGLPAAPEVGGEPGSDRQATIDRVAAESGLESDGQLAALSDAYDVVHDYAGALIVRTARDMLPDLRADVEEHPGARVVFVGRDGLSLAASVRALDPEFYAEHCSEIVLSRALVETAVQDLEARSGTSFPEIGGFRGAAGKVDPADTVGAYQQLTEYLRGNDIAAGLPNSHATLVDTSYKGTVQELLSAIYPDTTLRGRYLFFAASPDDPHPGTKFGYALHLEGDAANNGLPVTELPADPGLTFSHKDAIAAIEETLHGAGGSPKRMSGSSPEAPPADRGFAGFNPRVVSPRYADPAVREGVMRVGLGAVADLAGQAADPRGAASAMLDQRADVFRDQLRGWVGGGSVDPRLGEYLDSFVRRSDKGPAAQLAAVIKSAGIDPAGAAEAWRSFGRCGTLAEKEAFAARFARQAGGGRGGG